jgi:hypothetical protein
MPKDGDLIGILIGRLSLPLQNKPQWAQIAGTRRRPSKVKPFAESSEGTSPGGG